MQCQIRPELMPGYVIRPLPAAIKGRRQSHKLVTLHATATKVPALHKVTATSCACKHSDSTALPTSPHQRLFYYVTLASLYPDATDAHPC